MKLTLSDYAAKIGVKLTKPEINLLAKLEADYGLSISYDILASAAVIGKTMVINRFSGAAAHTNILFKVLSDFIYDIDNQLLGMTYKGKKVPVSIFDRTRYFCLKIDKAAYYAILD
jgi:hypothetical protein